jgi:hypothetical protein
VLAALGACTPLRPLDPIDAGSIDAGSIDAGPIDAGSTDAGPIDAGPIDAGPRADAAARDAGALDAHGADAWAPDAFVVPPDAWAPDAFVAPDAGVSPLIAYYPFDGTRDATGNGHTLSMTGVTLAGEVATLGLGDRIETPYRPDFDGIRALSVWVRVEDEPRFAARAGLVDHDAMFGLFHTGTGEVTCNVGGGVTRLLSTRDLPIRRWVHVTCALEVTTLRLYFDDDLVGETAAPAPAPSMRDLQIGQNCCDGADALVGDLSGVRVWSRAPTEAERTAILASPPP